MYKLLIAVTFPCLIWAGCKKSEDVQPASVVNGYLYYQNPASDGIGYYFVVDSTQELIVSKDFKDTQWATFLNAHVTMRFIDTGKKTCVEGIMTAECPPNFRLVQVIGFQKL
jgi:hypothetical protein